jgi:hypothetical protein
MHKLLEETSKIDVGINLIHTLDSLKSSQLSTSLKKNMTLDAPLEYTDKKTKKQC